MKIAAYQFSVSENIERNFKSVRAAATEASGRGARLLLLPECALCGYPPIESKMEHIDFELLKAKEKELCDLAAELDLSIAAGTIQRVDGKIYNAQMFTEGFKRKTCYYGKRALWGWDLEHFSPGRMEGFAETDGWKIGLRICFEVRFPEYFRELYRFGAELCLIGFCDHSDQPNPERYELITSFLRTRAMENLMPVFSCNSISRCQTAPTALFDRNGHIVAEAPRDREYLLTTDLSKQEDGFGETGRRYYTDLLTSSMSLSEKRV